MRASKARKETLMPIVAACPTCKSHSPIIGRSTFGGSRLHAVISVFECVTHGSFFVAREGIPGPGKSRLDPGDDESHAMVPKWPRPDGRSGGAFVGLRKP